MIRRRRRRWPPGSSRASAARIARSAQDSFGVPGLALEYGDLVAQEEDLGVLVAVGAGEQGKPAEDAEHRQVGQS